MVGHGNIQGCINNIAWFNILHNPNRCVKRPVDQDGYLEGTTIYAGIPYGDIYNIVKETCRKIKERPKQHVG